MKHDDRVEPICQIRLLGGPLDGACITMQGIRTFTFRIRDRIGYYERRNGSTYAARWREVFA